MVSVTILSTMHLVSSDGNWQRLRVQMHQALLAKLGDKGKNNRVGTLV